MPSACNLKVSNFPIHLRAYKYVVRSWRFFLFSFFFGGCWELKRIRQIRLSWSFRVGCRLIKGWHGGLWFWRIGQVRWTIEEFLKADLRAPFSTIISLSWNEAASCNEVGLGWCINNTMISWYPCHLPIDMTFTKYVHQTTRQRIYWSFVS